MSRQRPRTRRQQPRRNQQQIMNRAIELMEQQQPPRPYLITLPCACCGLGIERCTCDWSEL